MDPLDFFYLQIQEHHRDHLLSLRKHILDYNPAITEAWKFNMPSFLYNGNRFCYLRMDQKRQQYYMGFNDGKWINHPALMFEDRSRIKIFLIDPNADLPFETIDSIIDTAIRLYRE
jgi:hypothetical protein